MGNQCGCNSAQGEGNTEINTVGEMASHGAVKQSAAPHHFAATHFGENEEAQQENAALRI
jgi:hypothetical protein